MTSAGSHAVVLSGVEAGQPVTHQTNCIPDGYFFNIHMIGVQQHTNIGAVDIVDIVQGFSCCIDDTAFETVHRFYAVGNTVILRCLYNFTHAGLAALRECRLVIHDIIGRTPAGIADTG